MWKELRNPCAVLSKQGCAFLFGAVLALSPAVYAKPSSKSEKQVTSADKPSPDKEPRQQTPEPYQEKIPEKTREYAIDSRLTLGDGRTVRGTIRFRAPETLTLVHESEGVKYEKNIPFSEIESVEITKWKGKFLKEGKAGLVYEFGPDEYRINLRAGHELRRVGDFFTFLRQIKTENKNGIVVLFTYWIDLKKPDGSWYTGLSGPETGARVVSHPDVVRKIEFDK